MVCARRYATYQALQNREGRYSPANTSRSAGSSRPNLVGKGPSATGQSWGNMTPILQAVGREHVGSTEAGEHHTTWTNRKKDVMPGSDFVTMISTDEPQIYRLRMWPCLTGAGRASPEASNPRADSSLGRDSGKARDAEATAHPIRNL